MGAASSSSGSAVRAIAAACVLVAAFALLPRWLTSRRVGGDAPDFSLPIVANGAALGGENGTLHLSDLRGRAVLLDFWATWCGPCRAQAPIVDRVSRRWRDRGVVVIGVNTDGPDQGDPRAFAVAHGLTYPIVRDDSSRASRDYQVDGLPTLVVVSRAGKVVAVRTGITEDGELDRLIRLAM
jgi:thiol-disulfide isomerase/thioredoxin